MTSPVDFRRNSRRSSMYASPRWRAARTSAEPPIARSCSRRPSRTLIVVPNDDTVAPFSTSQFQPPSGSCSPRSRSTSGVMSTPKYAPVETTLPLMHGSTSPSKKRLSAHGVSNAGSRQMTRSLTRPTARRACSLSGSSPNRRRSSSTWKVSVQSWDQALPPTGHPAPGGRAAARPSPRWRPWRAPRRRPRPARRSGRASPASGSPGPNRAASPRRSRRSLPMARRMIELIVLDVDATDCQVSVRIRRAGRRSTGGCHPAGNRALGRSRPGW